MNKFLLATIFIASLFLHCKNAKAAENSRSDTIDILDYNIHLNVTDYSGKTISGFCIVTFKSKLDNISEVDLDLKRMKIDSIIQNSQQVFFTYTDSETIRISLTATLNAGDSSAVTVYYHGKPKQDSGGWGGWYWSGDYSFNIGVALFDIPHTFGRVWFPCIDNFVERSTYHISVITPADKMALCGGELISSFNNVDGTITWNWQLLQTIPSYLASVAVNKYAPAYGSYVSITGDTIPILYGAIALDTTKMKNSFVNLGGALEAFEDAFGKYKWNKVGYCETTVGSMEHSTNIAYPYFILSGTTTYEQYMAHELSHEWFGDLVTCRTAEDMWLNEGWADYCVNIFYEHVYGEDRYKSGVAANHESSVHYCHTPLQDSSYLQLGNVPQTHTYGETVYHKGADVAHTLRGYMGDSLFFHCLSNYTSDFAFKDASSADLRDYLTACSGIDLTDFFDDWVFNPGWTAFTIDSFHSNEDLPGTFAVDVYLKQRLDHSPVYFTNVPLEISFYDENRNVTVGSCMMSGRCGIFSFTLPFNPKYVGLDLNEKISDAVTADLKTLHATGSNVFTYGKMTLTVSSITDSALVRIEHMYAAPDPFKNPIPKLHISQERFWKVDGIFPAGFDASSTVSYNGSSSSGGFLDNHLITNVEDSLVVLYRKAPADDWSIENDVTQNFTGVHTDKKGSFTINHLHKGEYTFGIFQHNKIDSAFANGVDTCYLVSVPDVSLEGGTLNIFPNPSNDAITLVFNNLPSNSYLEIFNLYGREIYHCQLSSIQKEISVKQWTRGIYFAKISDKKSLLAIQKFVIN